MTSKISDKLKSLKLDGDVTLSCLCGMFRISGSARYLNEKKNSKKAVQCSFVQKIRTVDESISVKDDAIKDYYSTDIGDEGTHVVTGISWGANATVTLTYENNEGRSKDEIKSELKLNLGMLERVKLVSADEKKGASGRWLDKGSFKEHEMHLKVYADVLPNGTGAPRTFEEAMELIYNMPHCIAATVDGKGKQLELHLLPLSVLKKHLALQTGADQMFYEIETGAVKRLEQLFDGIEESREALNDLCTYLSKNALFVSPQDKNRIRKYQEEFEVAVYDVRDDLSQHQILTSSCTVNSNLDTNETPDPNNKEKKRVMKLYGVPLDHVLTVAGSQLNSSEDGLVVDCAIENYTNEKLKFVKVNIVRGEVPNGLRDIEPGEKLQFGNNRKQTSRSLFANGQEGWAVASWQYKDRLIVVITDIRNDNRLGIGITKPGVKHSDITIKYDKNFDYHCDSTMSSFNRSDCYYKVFRYAQRYSKEDISVEDGDIMITGRMGAEKNFAVEIKIIPHRDEDYAPQLIDYARDCVKKNFL
uniref:SNTX MACPF/CDC-like domain-containing protein n=1 Tax=Plectus sambesii TaxID=2011161 RepID=A0A914V1Q6_9BILA